MNFNLYIGLDSLFIFKMPSVYDKLIWPSDFYFYWRRTLIKYFEIIFPIKSQRAVSTELITGLHNILNIYTKPILTYFIDSVMKHEFNLNSIPFAAHCTTFHECSRKEQERHRNLIWMKMKYEVNLIFMIFHVSKKPAGERILIIVSELLLHTERNWASDLKRIRSSLLNLHLNGFDRSDLLQNIHQYFTKLTKKRSKAELTMFSGFILCYRCSQ